MAGVAVVTDTTHYLPAEMVEAAGLTLVSLYVNHDGRTEREADMPGFDAFYEELRSARNLPTTSQPSVGDFLAAFEPLVAEGRDVLSVHIAGGISGTVEAARQAATQLAEQGAGVGGNGVPRIEVVDSQRAAGGLGMVVLGAARLAAAGADLATCAARARELADSVRLWFAVDTLDFLQRGGRIGKARALVGSALRIKPILSFESEIVPVERVRTASRAYDRMVEFLRSLHADGADGWVVQHIRDEERAARLVDAGREIFGSEPLFVSEIGPVIGTHAGPGLLGVGGVRTSLLRP